MLQELKNYLKEIDKTKDVLEKLKPNIELIKKEPIKNVKISNDEQNITEFKSFRKTMITEEDILIKEAATATLKRKTNKDDHPLYNDLLKIIKKSSTKVIHPHLKNASSYLLDVVDQLGNDFQDEENKEEESLEQESLEEEDEDEEIDLDEGSDKEESDEDEDEDDASEVEVSEIENSDE